MDKGGDRPAVNPAPAPCSAPSGCPSCGEALGPLGNARGVPTLLGPSGDAGLGDVPDVPQKLRFQENPPTSR